MRNAVLIVALLTMSMSAPLATPALAQAAPAQEDSSADALPQMPLTDALLKKYIAAQADVGAVIAAIAPTADNKPDPKVLAKLEAAAKAHQFANYDEFDTLAGNIALVLDGVDPKTKTYIGTEAALKQQISLVQADKKMSDDERKEALDELNAELKSITPVKFPANIAVVMKYYDQLAGSDTPNP